MDPRPVSDADALHGRGTGNDFRISKALGRVLSAFGLEGLCGVVGGISHLGRLGDLSGISVSWNEGGVGGEYDDEADDRVSSSSLQNETASVGTERRRFVLIIMVLWYVRVGS